ncbi:olfactory receptor class A-like protein 4 [Lepisosteus oculatus]|uniref:olfactory receptor class A-like protein 4 n=1 Tax=Lepisosteus oculatus TaxID=7918 RepID=UPI0037217C4C
MAQVLPVDAILFGVLVLSGIVGNVLVICAVVQSVLQSSLLRIPPSDLILANLSLANLLTSFFRTVPIFVSDLGLEVSLAPGWCRLFMFLWVWWRAVGCWATLGLSLFHWAMLRRHSFMSGLQAHRAELRRVCVALALVWALNFAYSLPALVYSTHSRGNTTVELMVISCTTRPLLGCVWEFPSEVQGIAFATASLVVNELVPLVLMVGTNLASLCVLRRHIHTVAGANVELQGHMASERRASHVILVLVTLFVTCWGLQVTAVTHYNYNRGRQAETLLTVSHFAASVFVGFSPLVVALGHSKLRGRLRRMLRLHCGRREGPGGEDVGDRERDREAATKTSTTSRPC